MTDWLPVSRPYFFGSEVGYVNDALQSTMISGSGTYVDRMETLIAGAANRSFAVAVANGTVALDLAIKALGVNPGDEVIVPDFSMFSPIGALLRAKAKLVPVDADSTWHIDPEMIEAAIGPRTRGILVVHTYGSMADAKAICDLADRYGLWVLEDAAEALGATRDSRPAGSFGTVSTFSFYSNKVVTSGEGGAVTTDDPALAERMRCLRNLSFGETWGERFVHQDVGFNFRLSNLLAAVGCAQLESLDRALAAKRAIAAQYSDIFSQSDMVELQPVPPGVEPSNWVVGVLVPRGTSPSLIAKRLALRNIETRPFFFPVHRQPCLPEAVDGEFPRSDELSQRGLYLPSYIGIGEEAINRVADCLVGAITQ